MTFYSRLEIITPATSFLENKITTMSFRPLSVYFPFVLHSQLKSPTTKLVE